MTSRTRIDIIGQILKIANGGVTTKIKIMCKVNLSYVQLKEYLIALSDKNLLSYDLNTNTFKTTQKDLEFLEIYNKLNNLMSEYGDNSNSEHRNRESLREKMGLSDHMYIDQKDFKFSA